ncbi:hypothetical protein M422DRAFT_22709 [Sphaerobolus stellatus SS14]|nr:hypothetical protein M422DRAFT_22709 [Sphaerobolus stellatus SS14]
MQASVKDVVDANENYKERLDEYADKLRAELSTVNKLIVAVEDLEDENIEDSGDEYCIHVAGAAKLQSVIDLNETLKHGSPFALEAGKRERYLSYITSRPTPSPADQRYLEQAIIKENKRLAALHAQETGQSAFEAASQPEEAFLDNVNGIDWEIVARTVTASSSAGGEARLRTAQDCKVRWLGGEHPRLNMNAWNAEETKRLQDIVQLKLDAGEKLDWQEVANELQTNRTPVACIRQFQAKTKGRTVFKWTKELDAKLAAAVHQYGKNNWTIVALTVSPDLSGNQCYIRYERSVNPNVRKGPFSEEEDRILWDALKLYGDQDWLRIASAVPGRTNAQCRSRYYSLLKTVSDDAWSKGEDQKLMATVQKWSQDWQKIWEDMGAHRPITHYSSRYFTLVNGHPSLPPEPVPMSEKPTLRLRPVDTVTDTEANTTADRPTNNVNRPVLNLSQSNPSRSGPTESSRRGPGRPPRRQSKRKADTSPDIEEVPATGQSQSLPETEPKPARKRGRKRKADNNASEVPAPEAEDASASAVSHDRPEPSEKAKPRPKPRPVRRKIPKETSGPEETPGEEKEMDEQQEKVKDTTKISNGRKEKERSEPSATTHTMATRSSRRRNQGQADISAASLSADQRMTPEDES